MVFPCNAHIYVTKLLASLKGTLSIAKTGNGSEHRGRSLNEDDVVVVVIVVFRCNRMICCHCQRLRWREREEFIRSRNADGGFTPERNLI